MVVITKQRIEPDIVVLKLTGRLSIGLGSQELQWEVEALLGKGEKKLVFDLTDLKYMDSTGLGIVVFCGGQLSESGGHLRVAGANETISNLFRMTKIDQVLSLHATTGEAVASFTA
jgi:anti-sigma B factor antagonist